MIGEFLPPRDLPADETELLRRARALAGRSLGVVAKGLGWVPPASLTHAKGWVGQLLEVALGCSAGSRPWPDFAHLCIELKTLPVDVEGVPLESTFISTVDLVGVSQESWESSRVRAKLLRVLWLPVEADERIEISQRSVGNALLWSPSAEEEAILRADWEDLVSVAALGYVDSITAHRGRYLQMRPKGANASARTLGTDAAGEVIETMPRGFYLRRAFTRDLLARYFLCGRGDAARAECAGRT